MLTNKIIDHILFEENKKLQDEMLKRLTANEARIALRRAIYLMNGGVD